MYFAGDHLPKIHKTGELADSTVACWDGELHCRPLKSKVWCFYVFYVGSNCSFKVKFWTCHEDGGERTPFSSLLHDQGQFFFLGWYPKSFMLYPPSQHHLTKPWSLVFLFLTLKEDHLVRWVFSLLSSLPSSMKTSSSTSSLLSGRKRLFTILLHPSLFDALECHPIKEELERVSGDDGFPTSWLTGSTLLLLFFPFWVSDLKFCSLLLQ